MARMKEAKIANERRLAYIYRDSMEISMTIRISMKLYIQYKSAPSNVLAAMAVRKEAFLSAGGVHGVIHIK